MQFKTFYLSSYFSADHIYKAWTPVLYIFFFLMRFKPFPAPVSPTVSYLQSIHTSFRYSFVFKWTSSLFLSPYLFLDRIYKAFTPDSIFFSLSSAGQAFTCTRISCLIVLTNHLHLSCRIAHLHPVTPQHTTTGAISYLCLILFCLSNAIETLT